MEHASEDDYGDEEDDGEDSRGGSVASAWPAVLERGEGRQERRSLVLGMDGNVDIDRLPNRQEGRGRLHHSTVMTPARGATRWFRLTRCVAWREGRIHRRIRTKRSEWGYLSHWRRIYPALEVGSGGKPLENGRSEGGVA